MEDVNTPTEPRSTQIRAVVDASRRLIARYVTHFLDRNDTFPDAKTRESIQGQIEGILPHIASARDMLSMIASWWSLAPNWDGKVVLSPRKLAINIPELEDFLGYLKSAIWSVCQWSEYQSFGWNTSFPQSLPHQFSALKDSVFFQNGISRFTLPPERDKRKLLDRLTGLSFDSGIDSMDDRKASIEMMDTALRNMRLITDHKGEIARSNLHLQNFLRQYCDIYSALQEYIKKTDVLRELARVLIYWETM